MKKVLSLKLDRARWWVLQSSPFYGQLCMNLSDVIGNPVGKTACTDGTRIFWDADFLEKLTPEEVRFVLLHETCHAAHGHLWRFPKDRADHERANIACDHAINLTLLAAKLEVAMPKGGLADNIYQALAEEEIYARLPENPPQGGKGRGDDPCGDYCEPSPDSNGEDSSAGKSPAQTRDELKEKWEKAVIQAAQAAKATGCGNVPGDMSRLLDKLAAQPINWREETAQFIKNSASTRNDWTRASRRHAWQPVVYPRKKANEIGKFLAIRDTSGSINDQLCAEFSALLQNACEEIGCGLILLDCDTKIQAEHHIERGGEIPLTAKGGGGTDFTCIESRLESFKEDGETIAGVVVITDLDGSQFNPGEFESLWLCTTNKISTHGKTVMIL